MPRQYPSHNHALAIEVSIPRLDMRAPLIYGDLMTTKDQERTSPSRMVDFYGNQLFSHNNEHVSIQAKQMWTDADFRIENVWHSDLRSLARSILAQNRYMMEDPTVADDSAVREMVRELIEAGIATVDHDDFWDLIISRLPKV